jgi:hypothetical protein
MLLGKAGCNSARTAPSRSHAFARSLRTRAYFSRSVPAVGAKCNSSAPRDWFGRSPYPPGGVDPLRRPSDSFPKSRCRTIPPGSFWGYAPKVSDKFPTSFLASVADRVSYHLAGTPTQSQPNPALAPLFVHERPQLIQLQDLLVSVGRSQCSLQRGGNSAAFFEPVRNGIA